MGVIAGDWQIVLEACPGGRGTFEVLQGERSGMGIVQVSVG